MSYYEGERSLGLGPIVLAISMVTAIGFGALYYACGQTNSVTSQNISTPAQSSDSIKPIAQPAQAMPAAKGHNHV